VHLLNPRDLVPESNMPAFPWLAEAPVDAGLVETKLKRLSMLGDPYSAEDIAGVAAAVEGKTELDALVAYLQGLGRHAPKGR
jgi:cytochrome c oxidase cbb3-type subunit 2